MAKGIVMKTSENINELATALAAFQVQLQTLSKDKQGHGYKYAPLDVVTDAIREKLASNGLSYVQMPAPAPIEMGPSVGLTTRLMHTSGQWMESTYSIPVPASKRMNEAQAYGAALSYARRYALTAMLGIVADEDTDGAVDAPKQQAKPAKPVTANQLKALHAAGSELYGEKWDAERPRLVAWVSGNAASSSKALTGDQAQQLIDGIQKKLDERHALIAWGVHDD